jgi:hypothetical protein
MLHRRHIVILHPPLWSLPALRITRDDSETFGRSHSLKEGSSGVLTGIGNRNRNIREQHLFPYVPGTRSRNNQRKPIAAAMSIGVFEKI